MNEQKRRYFVVGGCLGAAWLIGLLGFSGPSAVAAPANQMGTAQTKPQVKPPPMSDQTIPGNPLRITARDSGSVGVYYGTAAQFYSEFAEGVYMWVGNNVWGPAGVPLGPTVNEYSPVSNSLVGSGTTLAPWRTTTTVRLGSTGVQLTRSVRYVNGDLWTRQDFEVSNTSSHVYNINLFHAADLQTGGSSTGAGYYNSSNGGIGSYDETHSFFQLFIPVTPNSRYKEDIWNGIWAAIGNIGGPGPGFDNSLRTDVIDNGAGLQWTFAIAPGQRIGATDFHSFSNTTSCGTTYRDVFPSDYYFDPVIYLACERAISGYSDGTFRPGNNTTRGQLSKIVVLAEAWTINTGGGPHFSDVQQDNPFYDYVETAYNRGVIAGYSDGTFKPNNDVTRGQLSKIIVQAEGWTINTGGGPHFSDVPPSYPFYQWIETAYNNGVISGYSDGTFRPGNSATRGQISKIIYAALNRP